MKAAEMGAPPACGRSVLSVAVGSREIVRFVPISAAAHGSMPDCADGRDAGWRWRGVVVMSAIAWFYLLDRSDVPGLVEAAKAEPLMIPAASHRWPVIGRLRRRKPSPPIMVLPVHNYLQENDLGVSDGLYDWSGYALMHLMLLLEETGTTLGTAEYRVETEVVSAAYGLTYLITSGDKQHLSALDPGRLDHAAAERYFDGLGVRFEQARRAIDDGLILLNRLIAALRDNEVLVINIG